VRLKHSNQGASSPDHQLTVARLAQAWALSIRYTCWLNANRQLTVVRLNQSRAIPVRCSDLRSTIYCKDRNHTLEELVYRRGGLLREPPS